MAHTVKRVGRASGVREGSMLYHAWKNHNALVLKVEGHVHGGVSAGGASTGGAAQANGYAFGAPVNQTKIANPDGKSPQTGATVGNTGPGNPPTRVDQITAAPGDLLAELIEAHNQLCDQVDNHVHTGVAGQANTSSPLTLAGAGLQTIVDMDGTDPYSRLTPPGTANAPKYQARRNRGLAGDLALLISQQNRLMSWLDGHTHAATSGGASTAGFVLPVGVQTIADENGRGPDGEVVT